MRTRHTAKTLQVNPWCRKMESQQTALVPSQALGHYVRLSRWCWKIRTASLQTAWESVGGNWYHCGCQTQLFIDCIVFDELPLYIPRPTPESSIKQRAWASQPRSHCVPSRFLYSPNIHPHRFCTWDHLKFIHEHHIKSNNSYFNIHWEHNHQKRRTIPYFHMAEHAVMYLLSDGISC